MKPLIDHLDELRKRLVFIVLILFFSFIVGVIISPLIIKLIINDLNLDNIFLVSLGPLEVIYTQIKVGFIIGCFLSLPFVLYHVILFIKPGMKRKERIALGYFLMPFLGLFILGVFFGYKIFLRIALFFLSNLSTTINIENLWSISSFVSFVVVTCFALGVIFELPLVLLILKLLGITNEEFLTKKRAYVYVLIFVIAALITPPDVMTMILIGLPVIFLYELSCLVMKVV